MVNDRVATDGAAKPMATQDLRLYNMCLALTCAALHMPVVFSSTPSWT
jgi:hypothetical protein